MSSILILGATGACGTSFIEGALKQSPPPKLTLYVRSPSKISPEIASATRVVEGALTDRARLEDALEGVDAVISFLGASPSLSAFVWRTKTTPIADCLPVVVEAMKAKGVKRILGLSTPSYRLPGEVIPWRLTLTFSLPSIMVPQGHAEMCAIAEALASSGLDYTVFRVPFLTDTPAAPVFAGSIGPDYKGSSMLSRPSLTKWLLDEIKERKWVNAAPSIAN